MDSAQLKRVNIMKLTKKQKQAIKQYYSHYYAIKFGKDGSVYAKKSASQSYGLLYNPVDTEKHLSAIGMGI